MSKIGENLRNFVIKKSLIHIKIIEFSAGQIIQNQKLHQTIT